jgi:hypothetical protein
MKTCANILGKTCALHIMNQGKCIEAKRDRHHKIQKYDGRFCVAEGGFVKEEKEVVVEKEQISIFVQKLIFL